LSSASRFLIRLRERDALRVAASYAVIAAQPGT